MNYDTNNRRQGLVLSQDTFDKLLAFIEDQQMDNDRLKRAVDELLMIPQDRCEGPEEFVVNCP